MQNQRDKILKLPSISDTLRENGFFTKKSLGQNFIFDLNITNKIVRHAGDLKDRLVIEIGPGVGSLTRAILLSEPKKLIAIERDDRTLPILNELVNLSDEVLEILPEDALNIDYKALVEKYNLPTKIIANLPYNIGTELLLRWLENIELFESLTLMFQREVAERIVAKPSSEHYGRLSILCNILCDCQIEFDLPPTAFFPAPKVFSAVVNLYPLKQKRYNVDLAKVKNVTRQAFSQKRKTLRNSLRPLFGEKLEEVFESLNIDSNLRAENLTVEQFCKLAEVLS
jgi:16S rRNA (adenine1518-N6/adenine1519-N6)-dimethyltransferase